MEGHRLFNIIHYPKGSTPGVCITTHGSLIKKGSLRNTGSFRYDFPLYLRTRQIEGEYGLFK